MAVDAVFVIDPVGFTKEFRTWEGSVGRYLKVKTELTRAVAVGKAPHPAGAPYNRTGINYATGRLASEHVVSYGRTTTGGDVESTVGALPEYATFLHGGTAPHVIRPRTAPRLVFFWHRKGRVVGLPKVNHPGTMANPWLADALKVVFG